MSVFSRHLRCRFRNTDFERTCLGLLWVAPDTRGVHLTVTVVSSPRSAAPEQPLSKSLLAFISDKTWWKQNMIIWLRVTMSPRLQPETAADVAQGRRTATEGQCKPQHLERVCSQTKEQPKRVERSGLHPTGFCSRRGKACFPQLSWVNLRQLSITPLVRRNRNVFLWGITFLSHSTYCSRSPP